MPETTNARIAPRDTLAQNATPSASTFALVLASLVAFSALAARFEHGWSTYFEALAVGFAIHYWLPFRLKEYFWYAFSVCATAVLLGETFGPTSTALAIGVTLALGLLIYAVFASPLPYAARALGVAAVFAGVIWWGGAGLSRTGARAAFVIAFGWAFSFRIFPYLHEARHFRGRANFRDFFRYFFLGPGFKLSTVDYQKLAPSYYRRDINAVAPQGARWIARGIIQYAVYAVCASHVHWIRNPAQHLSFLGVVTHLALGYTIYLNVSAQIHVLVGSTLLFGFDLPSPFRWFGLAHSPLDFWRRANIYWKDIMLKTVFLPVYFALRKRGDLGAKLTGTALVFLVTWVLHVWNDFWHVQFRVPFWRELLTTPSQLLFWGSYGVLCMGNMVLEERAAKTGGRSKRPALAAQTPPRTLTETCRRYVVDRLGVPAGMHPLRAAAQILALQTTVAALFSLRHAPSIQSWLWTMMWWR